MFHVYFCRCGEQDEEDTCRFEGEVYQDGARMGSKHDPCLLCHCQASRWNETDPGDDLCYRRDCLSQGRDQIKLMEGCSPVYRDDVCCPVDWVCPGEHELEPIELGDVVDDDEDAFAATPNRKEPEASEADMNLPQVMPTVQYCKHETVLLNDVVPYKNNLGLLCLSTSSLYSA